ncbi:MAG TPA: FAD-dependent oxidoreductase [Thermoanaerobaculia bacterium]|nr:FAD-dependent oxidoreductase [Thermoanaerobaculia bacterium]
MLQNGDGAVVYATMQCMPSSLAIIGSGVAGLGAAWRLYRRCDLRIYEAGEHVGGHAITAELERPGGGTTVTDLGFLVHMPALYPSLSTMFRTLGVATEPSGPVGCTALLGNGVQWTNNGQVTPYWRERREEASRFEGECTALFADRQRLAGVSTRTYLREHGYSAAFGDDCLAPLLSFLFITRSAQLDLPLNTVTATFVAGMYSFASAATCWRVVSRGSREYVARLIAPFADRIRLRTKVARIARDDRGVTITDATGREERFDRVLIAAHADEALAMLADPSDDERRLLGAAVYERAVGYLHRDPRVMPSDRALWSAFVYARDEQTRSEWFTYWLRPLQPWIDEDLFLTVDPPAIPEAPIRRIVWNHFLYDNDADLRVPHFAALQGQRHTWYCGEYTTGPGHEAAFVSGLKAAAMLTTV